MQIPIESMNLLMLNVGMARHNGDWNWKNVNSPFTRIYYVVEGEAQLHLCGKTVRLRPRHLYIIPAYTTHSYECTGLFTHYYLHVYEGYKNEMSLMELYDFPTEVEATEGDERLFQRMCEQQPEARLPESNPQAYDNATQFTDDIQRYNDMGLWEKMELRGAILMLFSRFMRVATPHVWTQDERMKKVLDHIHHHLDHSIDVDQLASVACISKPYLIRLFKREFGTSPVQYINKKKVEKAQLLLFSTDKPVKEIAYVMGFSDHSYFIRLFRKLTGLTPQEYRTMLTSKSG
jgi:AraC-like DNA-binding protein